MELMFSLVNLVILPIWAALILAPRSRFTARLIATPWVIVPPSLLYGVIVLPRLLELLPAIARPELAGIQALLGTPAGAVAAWAHFAAFDLFVGRYIALDARERDLPALVLSVILALTLLFGPLGLLSYLSLRGVWPALRRSVGSVKESSPALLVVSVVSALVCAVSVVLQQVDLRQVDGVSVWLKPAKFGVSIAITSITLALILPAVQIPLRRRRLLVGVIAGGFAFDLAVITLQSARGVASHFNAATWYDRVAYLAIGSVIAVVMLALAELGVRAFRTKYDNRAFGWGIRTGLVLMVLGCNTAWFMSAPTAEQLDHMKSGGKPELIGSHSVGEADAERGMPLTRWNSDAGDLRVAHFIGTHSLQVMPVVGLWLGRRRKLQAGRAEQLTIVAAFAYLGLVVTTLVQALRGLPFWQLDAITAAVGGTSLGGCVLAVLWILRPRELPQASICATATAHR